MEARSAERVVLAHRDGDFAHIDIPKHVDGGIRVVIQRLCHRGLVRQHLLLLLTEDLRIRLPLLKLSIWLRYMGLRLFVYIDGLPDSLLSRREILHSRFVGDADFACQYLLLLALQLFGDHQTPCLQRAPQSFVLPAIAEDLPLNGGDHISELADVELQLFDVVGLAGPVLDLSFSDLLPSKFGLPLCFISRSG